MMKGTAEGRFDFGPARKRENAQHGRECPAVFGSGTKKRPDDSGGNAKLRKTPKGVPKLGGNMAGKTKFVCTTRY